MATYEQDIVMYETKENGDKVIKMPISRVNNIEGIGRSANTAYVVGDVVYVDNNKKVALKCTQAGTTSNSELNVSTASVGNVITDGTVKWQVCNRTSDVTSVNGQTGDVVVDLPVGHMYWSVEPNVPAGRLPALGATYNRSLYADLWAWANSVGLVKTESEWQAIASANDGNCAYYSSGDGSTTFRVPALKCWVKGASSVDEIGSYLQAGLPNGTGLISGTYGAVMDASIKATGAFTITNVATGAANSGSQKRCDLGLDLSRSNHIYGNSDTVQPPSIVGMWLIVAYGVAHNIGEADVADVMSAVEQVQTGLGKVDGISDYIIESYRNGTEWYEVYRSGKVRQGGRYDNGSALENYTATITLLKKMANANYDVDIKSIGNTTAAVSNIESRTENNMVVHLYRYTATSGVRYFNWEVEGQGV